MSARRGRRCDALPSVLPGVLPGALAAPWLLDGGVDFTLAEPGVDGGASGVVAVGCTEPAATRVAEVGRAARTAAPWGARIMYMRFAADEACVTGCFVILGNREWPAGSLGGSK